MRMRIAAADVDADVDADADTRIFADADMPKASISAPRRTLNNMYYVSWKYR